MIAGHATAEGTRRYAQRFAGEVAEGHFRPFGELTLSSIGLGTYLGSADEATDAAYEEAILDALASGSNVIDTAINYRHQRSERAVGRALARAVAEGRVRRDEVFVSSKAGFLPFDTEPPGDPQAFIREVYIESGLLHPEDIVGACHAIAPGYLGDQLTRSRANLGLEQIDLYYLHNPEIQFEHLDVDEAADRLRTAMSCLEQRARDGAIGCWGVATWNGLRSRPGSRGHLESEEIVTSAIAATPDGRSHLKAVQLPLNLAMPEALAAPTQTLDDVTVPFIVAARKLNLAVFTSASILQGRLATGLPREIAEAFPGLATDAQRALQFARSAPGVTSALVGMSAGAHVAENLALAGVAPVGTEVYERLL